MHHAVQPAKQREAVLKWRKIPSLKARKRWLKHKTTEP